MNHHCINLLCWKFANKIRVAYCESPIEIDSSLSVVFISLWVHLNDWEDEEISWWTRRFGTQNHLRGPVIQHVSRVTRHSFCSFSSNMSCQKPWLRRGTRQFPRPRMGWTLEAPIATPQGLPMRFWHWILSSGRRWCQFNIIGKPIGKPMTEPPV